MPRAFAVLVTLVAAVTVGLVDATAQSLEAIEAKFAKRRTEAAAASGGVLGHKEYRELWTQFAKALQDYLSSPKSAKDASQTRLILTTLQTELGDVEAARSTLKALDPARSGPIELLEAAELATGLELSAQREQWIEAAEQKDAPLATRMQVGMFLLTRLVEVERAKALFDRELAAAKDVESKAEVRWHVAAAVREREDREEGDYLSLIHI